MSRTPSPQANPAMKLSRANVIGATHHIHWTFACERCSARVEIVTESGPNQSIEAAHAAATEHGACP